MKFTHLLVTSINKQSSFTCSKLPNPKGVINIPQVHYLYFILGMFIFKFPFFFVIKIHFLKFPRIFYFVVTLMRFSQCIHSSCPVGSGTQVFRPLFLCFIYLYFYVLNYSVKPVSFTFSYVKYEILSV